MIEDEITHRLTSVDEATGVGDCPFASWLQREFIDHAKIPDEYRIVMRIAWEAGVAHMRKQQEGSHCGQPQGRSPMEPNTSSMAPLPVLSEWEFDDLVGQEWEMQLTTPLPTAKK